MSSFLQEVAVVSISAENLFDAGAQTESTGLLLITLGHAPGMQPCNGKSCVDSNMHSMQVNQRYWLQLRRGIELQGRHYTFDMCLVPQYLPKEENVQEMGVLEHLIYAAYRGQGKCIDEPPVITRWPGILFRFQWPPKFMQPPQGIDIFTSRHAFMLLLHPGPCTQTSGTHQEQAHAAVLWLYCGATSSFSCAVSHKVIYL